ncbi:MAG: glycosyltransferase family 4 protein [Verrucomicrobiota bacterium]|jgi:glycosyltransferase involved in cell wall biosynthesis
MNEADPRGEKKILFLGHSASRSGAPLVLLHWLKWFKQNAGMSFEILLKEGGPLEGDFAALAPTTVLRRSRFETILNNLCHRLRCSPPAKFTLSAKALEFARGRKVRLIHANTVAVAEEVAVLAGLKLPIVWHVHEMPFAINCFQGGRPFAEASRFATAFIAASEGVRQGLVDGGSIPAAKITVIREFIPWIETSPEARLAQRVRVRKELALPAQAFVAGMCGTVEWRKGADLFVGAARQCRAEFPGRNIYFLWVGAPDHALTQRQVDHDLRLAGLTDTVRFIGGKSDSLPYLAAMDVFALTSREDPFPLAMLEAAALGLPIVCFSRSGGGPEFVAGDAGVIVEYADSLALARALARLSGEPALCRQLGDAGRAKVRDHYTVEKQAPKILQFLGETGRLK